MSDHLKIYFMCASVCMDMYFGFTDFCVILCHLLLVLFANKQTSESAESERKRENTSVMYFGIKPYNAQINSLY